MSWYIEEQSPVYLDYNATSPLAPEVKTLIVDSLEQWVNPSSNTPEGKTARAAIEDARAKIAELFHVTSAEVYFTSGGTESNSWIIHSVLEDFRRDRKGEKPHVITSEIDHPAIVKPLKKMVERGEIDATICPIDAKTGTVNLKAIEDAICERTCLVTVMLANNETGVIQPIAKISDLARRAGEKFGNRIIVHTDSCQAIGKIDVNLDALQVDAITVGGHKFYGPRVGALVIRSQYTFKLNGFIHGCGQERGLRGGTENTPMLVGLGKAAELAGGENLSTNEAKMREVRDYFEEQLKTHLPEHALVHFQASPRLPNTSNVCFPKYADTSLDLLDKCKSFRASTGAAGHSHEKCGSAVLKACGIPNDLSARSVRFSFGRNNTKEEVDRVIKELKAICFLDKFGSSLLGAINKGVVAGF